MWSETVRILPKDFLSLEDIAIYFKSHGYNYDLEVQSEYQRFIKDIYDLIIQRKINPVFHYYGFLIITKEEYEYEEGFKGEIIKVPIHVEESKSLKGDYFQVNKSNLKELFLDKKTITLTGLVAPYRYETEQIESNTDISYDMKDKICISLDDIRIPLQEINNFFNEQSENSKQIYGLKSEKIQSQLNQAQNTIKEQQARIADLEQRLKQTQLNTNAKISERHEKSYQVTIGLLLELLTTPKGTDDKPPFQSQASIISEIVDKDIYGQKKTTLETRFSTANNVLKDIKRKKLGSTLR